MPKTVKHRIVDRLNGRYADIIVYERNQYRSVHFTDGPELSQGRRHRHDPLGYSAEYLRQILAATTACPAPQRVLCLGLGIGAIPTLMRAILPELRIDAVEIEPAMVKAAQRYFGLKVDEKFKVYVDDARSFLKRRDVSGAYDIVIIDCYDESGIAQGCESPEFYEDAVGALSGGGALISNLVAGRAGAHTAIDSMRGVVSHPWAIGAPTKSNWTLVGMKSRILDVPEMTRRAETLDDLRRLRWCLADEMSRVRPSWEIVQVLHDLQGQRAAT